jgi:hypothetical protein
VVFLSLVSTLTRAIHSLELIFRDTLAHGSSTGDTTRNHLEKFVDVVGSGPFLMFEDFDAVL